MTFNAEAQTKRCDTPAIILNDLKNKANERIVAQGFISQTQQMMMTVAPDGTWSLVIISQIGSVTLACIEMFGGEWVDYPRRPGGTNMPLKKGIGA